MTAPRLRATLEVLRMRYAHRRFIHPDPLEFLHRYPDPRDREVVGLVAAGLAYGRVASILNSVERALAPLGPRPASFLRAASATDLARATRGFRHRWTSGAELGQLLRAVRNVLRTWPSLEDSFRQGWEPEQQDVWPALESWVVLLGRHGLGRDNSLVAWPDRGGACKRLHLYMRWMARADRVDPGGWTAPARSQLLVPVDVHMHRIARALGFTRRRQADRRTVDEITAGFRRIAPEDPVRYDFALTRLPIRDRLSPLRIRRLLRQGARRAEEITPANALSLDAITTLH